MAGEWIKMELGTVSKPEVMRLSRILNTDIDFVIGKLIRLWIWFDRNSVDGHVDGLVDADVDGIVSLSGFAAALKQVGWLRDSGAKGSSDGLVIPNFSRHNGESAKKRALKNERQARWRKGVDASSPTKTSTQASTSASTREEKRREEKEEKKESLSLPSWVPEDAWKAWLEVRPKVRAPNTPNALKLALRDLESLRDQGNDPRAVLEAAVVKGWRGLFPVANAKSSRPVADA